MQTPASASEVERASAIILELVPESARDMYGAMIELGLAQMDGDTVSHLADDLQSAKKADGGWELESLINVARKYGMPDAMIEQLFAQAKEMSAQQA